MKNEIKITVEFRGPYNVSDRTRILIRKEIKRVVRELYERVCAEEIHPRGPIKEEDKKD